MADDEELLEGGRGCGVRVGGEGNVRGTETDGGGVWWQRWQRQRKEDGEPGLGSWDAEMLGCWDAGMLRSGEQDDTGRVPAPYICPSVQVSKRTSDPVASQVYSE